MKAAVHANPARLPMPDVGHAQDQIFTLSVEEFSVLARYISRKLGLEVHASKRAMLSARLARRLRALGYQSFAQYWEHLNRADADGAEQRHFIDLVTTHKTEFFREPEHFLFLSRTVLPKLVASMHERRMLNVWSAGCSTGEEAYSIAMVCQFALERAQSAHATTFAVWGTDVSARAVDVATTAVYPLSAAENIPQGLRSRYLLRGNEPESQRIRVAPELRARTRFHVLNFADSSWGAVPQMSVIFCRNVLIYFERSDQRAVVARLCEHLEDGGYLFLGHAETLVESASQLRALGDSVYVKRPAANLDADALKSNADPRAREA